MRTLQIPRKMLGIKGFAGRCKVGEIPANCLIIVNILVWLTKLRFQPVIMEF
jgi:hypothetical protein